MQPVRMKFGEYILNLIDTPGHVDFSYEVSRSLAAVEGAILLVDATKGIQAQTIGNLELAKKQKLTIIPVINKIDSPQARIVQTREEMVKLLDIDAREIIEISAKHIIKIRDKLNKILAKHTNQPLKNIERDTDREFYLEAQGAKDYGMIDEIIKK